MAHLKEERKGIAEEKSKFSSAAEATKRHVKEIGD
jgi:hypothetical protein